MGYQNVVVSSTISMQINEQNTNLKRGDVDLAGSRIFKARWTPETCPRAQGQELYFSGFHSAAA